MIAFTDLFFEKQSPCKLQQNFSKSVRRFANLLYSAVQKYATFSIKQATNNYIYYFICYNYNNDIYYYYYLLYISDTCTIILFLKLFDNVMSKNI